MIEIIDLQKAINILSQPGISEDEIFKCIALLGSLTKRKTCLSPYLKKDLIVIGTREGGI